MNTFNGIGSNGSIRMYSRANQPSTSSNPSFNKAFRNGVASGVNMSGSALRQLGSTIPGSAALTASMNDAARTLSGPSSLDGISSKIAPGAADSDMGTLQNEMLRNNQDMLEQQVQVSRITTEYSTRSYILKAMFDALKTIGSNIR